MVFKKYDEQKVYQVPCISEAGEELEVGDVFAHNPDSKEIEKIESKADAVASQAEGIRTLYMVAQGDAITNKTGTAYKNYDMNSTVSIQPATETIVAAYRITMIDNVEWEA